MCDNKTGILLLSHGSRLDDGERVINNYKDFYLKNNPDANVEVGFMEIRKPSIPEAFESLKAKGDLDKIIVVPVFVANGVHTKKDIPKILGLNDSDEGDDEHHHHHHSGEDEHHHHHHDVEKVDFDGEIILTDPLGFDERISDIINDRIEDAL
ncbi:MAG: sirohydrochlorin nickelochelatase [Methanobrevibacter boviskoreani]|jgi:sirohydrochlorin ferrochelatase|uniref:sirohydrochlorin nickelochelatase n=1 Tax=Methanobrevibacter TaxID=2172 RepID=UPI0003348913|nr:MULTISPECIES: sirohydrochlorin nickelochelatase [Methanobrevibacter]AGN16511.1 cobalamin biosynthesis protein CbiX1 [Methanobrevibacter sp. AbM4]MCI6774834.1 sirohydrochlorin nickelochelatase [Methanobrevibacter boviskoreani]MCI6931326.1 sirohydrochlorin nickelochelatase [Methanobrevibacter boviskoreani]MDD6256371.1 sirohydrochlorin nickelochelatase [Methanobrevibacter boviskoreani]MDY5613740.1 sirohydrochlorin nickelochelatase [Methanobrevibacter boviskoreani]